MSPFDLQLLSADGMEVSTNGGVRFRADRLLSDADAMQLLIVPGGIGTRRLRNEQTVLNRLSGQAGTGCIMASVCTGALLLGAAGLLDGRDCTTHWMFTQQLQEQCPDAVVHKARRVLDDGTLITAAGVTAGIDLGLYLCERFVSHETAMATAAYIEYDPDPRYRFTPPA